MNIQMDKEYTTLKGHEVVIYSILGEDERYPIHGAWRGPNGVWQVEQWTTDGVGRHMPFTSWRLVEKPKPKKKVVGYVNIFPNGRLGYIRGSSKQASFAACDNPIACVRVEFEYEEGQFDD